MKIYLENGGDVNVQRQWDGKTLMHVATENNNHEIIEILYGKNPNLNLKDKNGNTPAHLAIIENVDEDIIRMIIKHRNVNLNIQNNRGQTLLHLAVNLDRIFLVQQLVQLGVDVNIKNNLDRTPLDEARRNRYWNIASYIKKHSKLNENGKIRNATVDREDNSTDNKNHGKEFFYS